MITSIERNAQAEIKMLKSIIKGIKEQIELSIDAEMYDGLEEMRQDVACYEAELAKYF